MTIKKIGIFGGSFNPPHRGHRATAEYVLKEKKADEIWVIPCWEHPFDKPLVPFEHRLKMCALGMGSLGNQIRCLDIEKKLGGKSYTFRTVSALKQKYPEHRFYLIVGEDVAEEAKQWNRYEELKKSVEWIVIPRGEGSPIPNISATEVRTALALHKNLEGVLEKNVVEYIERHGLYKSGT